MHITAGFFFFRGVARKNADFPIRFAPSETVVLW